jgi:hypothetical protein
VTTGTGELLPRFVSDLARAVEGADARHPVASNMKTGQPFAPGLGPHSEEATFRLVLEELRQPDPGWYRSLDTRIPYPSNPRQKCDLGIDTPCGLIYVEGKLLRLLGDNGKPNDNMLMHILSPYPHQNSALTDCSKLAGSGFTGRLAIIIIGYNYARIPLQPAIDAFEVLASRSVGLGPRLEAGFAGLCHAVHNEGKVLGWEVLPGEVQ